MNIRESLEKIISVSIETVVKNNNIELEATPAASLERPRDESNGDWASTVAMRFAKQAKMNPRELASQIVDNIPENDMIASLEIAGPGFINIRLTDSTLQSVVSSIRNEGANYGRGSIPEGSRSVNLEYISANPTGPMHVGHGRWATLGDAMARVMRHAGYDVFEEFYVNDHGNQMNVFGNSVSVRYMQLLGHDIEMPEQCYGGSYVIDIARTIIDEMGNTFESMSDDDRAKEFRDIAYKMMLDSQKNLLSRYGVTFDRWFSESTLYKVADDDKSAIERALEVMREKGFIYEKEGATWFRSTAFDDEKDRVLIKKDGEFTYFMSDVAYHYDKICRGFDHLIDIWGADHHGYIKRCEAMLAAWGYPGRLEIVLGQLVNLYRDGEAVRMSKRTGEMVTFEELIDEVGVDATRFLMLSRSSDQQIDFDIEQAKKKDASNPVYYVQYAHARICSIIRKGYEAKFGEGSLDGRAETCESMDDLASELIASDTDLSALTHDTELSLIRTMSDFGELIELAARDRAPFRLTHYSEKLASQFHSFYTECKVISDDVATTKARLALCDATRMLLELTLSLMGISAPCRM